MIKLITGVPGSGKTYYAVNIIYQELISKESKYRLIYTNINLNFDKCNEIKKDFVKPLILDDLLERIEKDFILSEKFKNNNLIDEETGKLVTDYDAYVRGKLKLFESYEHSLIILDECHLYFTDKQDPKMLRFLSYHRHFDIDMYLITQNKSLINRKYLAFVENLIKARNPSKRFFSKVFVYDIYASYQEYKSNLAGKEKLKFDKNIANLYNSGSNKIPPSFAKRMFFPFIIFSILTFLFFKGFINYVKCKKLICYEKNSVNNIQKVTYEKNNIQNNYSKSDITEDNKNDDLISNSFADYRFFYKIICFKEKCILNNGLIIHKKFLDFLLENADSYGFSITTLNSNTYYLAINIDLSKFLGVQNEEVNNTDSIFN